MSTPAVDALMEGSPEFTIKDSGKRQEFSGGMVRDTTEGKTSFLNVRFGPMLRRWAAHLTKGRQKYPDPEPGIPNWTLAQGIEEWLRARDSAARHFEQWLAGDRDEDHAAAVYFNVNLKEYVEERLSAEDIAQAMRIEALERGTPLPAGLTIRERTMPPAEIEERYGRVPPPEAVLPLVDDTDLARRDPPHGY